MRVLLAEENAFNAESIYLALKSANIFVDYSNQGGDALEMASSHSYDIVLVSMELSDMNGFDFVRRMRTKQLNMPVLVLADSETAERRRMTFSIGADDLVGRPVDHNGLVLKLHAIVRRMNGYNSPIISAGAVQINQSAREVTVKGVRVALTGKEYAILELMVLRKGQVLTKDAFLNHLYGGMYEPEMKIIDAFICKVRKKLLAVGIDNLIATVRGRGYIVHEKNAISTAETQIVQKSPVMC